MNFFKTLINRNTNKNTFTLFTGGHLKFTYDIINKLTKQNPGLKFLVLFSENNYNNKNTQNYSDNVQIFNCDINKSDDLDEFAAFLKSNKEIKVK